MTGFASATEFPPFLAWATRMNHVLTRALVATAGATLSPLLLQKWYRTIVLWWFER